METETSGAITDVESWTRNEGGFRDAGSSRPRAYGGEGANNGFVPSLRLLERGQ